MATEDKNGVIYLEVDEDITSAIDKLGKSTSDKVQIVTAKRSTLFQSVINLRLLQKAAKDGKKDLVLVTSDRVATNLAGRVGVPVASQVGEAASIPKAVGATGAVAEDEIDGGTVGDEKPPEPEAPAEETPAADEKPEPPAPAEPAAAVEAAKDAAKTPRGKRVPNIGKMQKRLLWIGLAVAAVIIFFVLTYFLASAKVTLYAKGSQVNASFDFTADPNSQQSDIQGGTLAANQVTNSKSLTGNVQATGTKDEGSKASGTMTVYNNYDSNNHQLVAGTRFVAGDGHVFRSTSDTTVPGGTLSGGHVVPGKTTVGVQADQNGDDYNLGPTRYSIPGLSADEQSGIYGQGDQMHGGTSKKVKVITQGDVERAKQAALAADQDNAKKDLKNKAGSSQTVLDPSFQATVANADPNPNVGSTADSGSVSIQVNYSELAVRKSELSDLSKSEEEKQIGQDKQIYDDGSGNLRLSIIGKPGNGAEKFSAAATAFAGTKIDKAGLAKQIKGKKYGDAVDTASHQPDIDHAEIKLFPGWSTGLPHIASHIHIDIKVAKQ